MKFHRFAEIFPLIEGDDFAALVADIEAHGLQEKIVRYDGKVLDGRNRFLACQKAKVKPQYRDFKGTDEQALAFVVSANVQRRHLTASQLSMASARLATLRSGQRSDHVEGVSIETASEMVGASVCGTKRARKVINEGSKALQNAVDSGEVSVSKAVSVVDLPKSEQLAAAKAKPAKAPEPEPEASWEPDEEAALEQAEKELAASVDKVMASDDRLAASYAEMKRQAAEIASLKLSRDGFQNRCNEILTRYKALQRKAEKLEKENQSLRLKGAA